MNPSRSEIARERRRQMQVRQALEAGVALPPGTPGLGAFLDACAAYMVFSMERLHAQDQLIHDLTGARLPSGDTEAHAMLKELDDRQDRSRALMVAFEGELARFRAHGAAGLVPFRDYLAGFAASFRGLLLPRKNPFSRWTDVLLDDGDWQRIAGVTAESTAREAALFETVRTTAPEGIDPERYAVVHG